MTEAQASVASLAARLAASRRPGELLAETVPARKALGLIPRRASMRRVGEGWRLGVLLVTREGELFAARQVFRAARQVLPGHQSTSAQQRLARRLVALDAGFPDGSTIVLYAPRIPLDDAEAMRAHAGPVVVRDGRLLVRWMPGSPDDALTALDAYLNERLDLALGRQG